MATVEAPPPPTKAAAACGGGVRRSWLPWQSPTVVRSCRGTDTVPLPGWFPRGNPPDRHVHAAVCLGRGHLDRTRLSAARSPCDRRRRRAAAVGRRSDGGRRRRGGAVERLPSCVDRLRLSNVARATYNCDRRACREFLAHSRSAAALVVSGRDRAHVRRRSRRVAAARRRVAAAGRRWRPDGGRCATCYCCSRERGAGSQVARRFGPTRTDRQGRRNHH